MKIDTGEFVKEGVSYNGKSPGPVLRFKEGEEVSINVTNNLDEMTSIHWHGLILPFERDGVPGISFPGIKPGETFTYRFPIAQSGTYWFHSHSGFQEPEGAFGSIIIEPEGREPFRYDREYVVQLTDKHPHSSERVMRNLKVTPDYYNRKQQTLGKFFSDASENGFLSTVKERLAWGGMRMMQADVEDLQGFIGMINGKSPKQNWTGIFEPGERIRLRFINSSAMTYFDIRIPGLEMTVVQADGNNVQPVNVDEFRIGVAETYDVIVRPKDEQAYTIFAESMGRSGYARATLATEAGMEAAVPELREPARLTMADMGGMPGMDHGDMPGMDHSQMGDMDHSNMASMDHGPVAMPEGGPSDPFYAKGSGLVPTAANGVKYEDADPIRLKYGERVRFKFVNETMMTHPMHLHGMWSILDVGAGQWNPIKHTVSVQPGTTVYMETEVDAPGQWAFHCHLTYHMAAGMFRKVIVEGGSESAQAASSQHPSDVGGDV